MPANVQPYHRQVPTTHRTSAACDHYESVTSLVNDLLVPAGDDQFFVWRLAAGLEPTRPYAAPKY